MSKILIGKTITKMKIADDKKAILFITDDGEIIAKCDGDCCSNTWVEHIELPVLGFPAKVISVDDLDMPDLGQPDEYEVIAYYGCKIVTDKGDIVIDYRNESNGYYGGNLSWPDDNYFYGGVYGQNVSKNNWVDVNTDV
jgi:hypothetical protein